MNVQAALIALLAYAIFATHDVVVKILGAQFSPFQIVFFSSLFSFPLLTLMLVKDASPGNLRPVHPVWVALRSLCLVIGPVSAFFAFQILPLPEVYPVLFAAPLLVTALAIPILGERIGLWRGLAVLGGLAGVLIVIQPGSSAFSWGHAAAFLAALTSALQSVIVRKIGRDERRAVLMLYPLLINVVIMGIAMMTVYEPMTLTELGGTAVVALLGFIATLLLVYAYTVGESAVVAPMHYSQIIWAVAFGYFLFGESIDRTTVFGALLIMGSGVTIILRETFGGTSKETPVLRTRTRGFSPGSFRISTVLKRPKPD